MLCHLPFCYVLARLDPGTGPREVPVRKEQQKVHSGAKRQQRGVRDV
jgi:hypothetical protein